MATITNNQVQAGRAELCNYFKSPYQIINALNRFAATNDLTALNAELEADGQKERLSNEAFHAVATAVQEHHGGGRPFVANMLDRSGNGCFIQHRRRDVCKLGYFARANEGNFGYFGGAHSYSDDLFELLGVADLEHVTGSTDAADARYTVRINDTPRSYYNEFASIVRDAQRAAEKAEKQAAKQAARALLQEAKKAEKAAKKALNEATAAAKRECKNTLAGLTADYNNNRINAAEFAAKCREAKKASDAKIKEAERKYNLAKQAA